MLKHQASPAALLGGATVTTETLRATTSESPANRTGKHKLTASIVGSDPVAATTLRHMLQQTGLFDEIQEWGSTRYVEVNAPQDIPDIVFMEFSGESDLEFALSQSIAKLRPGAHLVACSANKQSDPDFLLQAMRAGVRDFLEKPFDRIDVAALAARVGSAHCQETTRPATAGKMLAVLGTKGGVGTSTVAVNLAVQLAGIRGKTAVLLDLSRPMGDVAALLDLNPRFQLRDALESSARLDVTMLRGLLTAHPSGLLVLAGAAQLEDWNLGTFGAVERLVEVAQQNFDFVVLDLGSNYSAEWKNIFQASEVLLVSEADLPGLAKLHRHLQALGNLRINSPQLRLVINRWHRHDEAALDKVEKDMRMPVFARLPNDFKKVNDATIKGGTISKGDDPLSSGFREMAGQLAGARLAESPKKRLSQFFTL